MSRAARETAELVTEIAVERVTAATNYQTVRDELGVVLLTATKQSDEYVLRVVAAARARLVELDDQTNSAVEIIRAERAS